MKRDNTQYGKEGKPKAGSESEYDIPPIDATPEELAKSMFSNACRKLAGKKSQNKG